MTSSNVLFCLKKSPKPAVIQLIIYDNTKRPHPIDVFMQLPSLEKRLKRLFSSKQSQLFVSRLTRYSTRLETAAFPLDSLRSLKQHFTIHNGLHTARKHITSSWQTLQLMLIQNRSLLRHVSRFLRLPSTSFSQVQVFCFSESCDLLRYHM